MGKLVTTTELVEVLDVSRTTLAKAVESGRLTVKKRDGRGRPQFDLEQAVREWAERHVGGGQQAGRAEGKNKGGRPPKSEADASITPATAAAISVADIPAVLEGPEFAALVEKLATLTPAQQRNQVDVIKSLRQAQHIEVQVRKDKARLVDVEKVAADGAELGTALLGSLSALPSRLYQQLAIMTDPREIHDLLAEEVGHMVAAVRKGCGLDDGGDDEAEKKIPA